jgi:hypothetical protein
MDAKLKHLEFLQSAISRMATNSFLFKGWAITLAAALSAAAATIPTRGVVGIAIASTVAFWWLDAFFLTLERGYRDIYDTVRTKKADSEIDFSMNVREARRAIRWVEATTSVTLVLFYIPILIAEAVVLAVM